MLFYLAKLIDRPTEPFRVPPEPVQIGRAGDCELQLTSCFVSRHHAEAWVEAGALHLRDLGSRNGTVVDGATIGDEIELSGGEVISFGPESFVVFAAEEEDNPNTPTAALEECGSDCQT